MDRLYVICFFLAVINQSVTATTLINCIHSGVDVFLLSITARIKEQLHTIFSFCFFYLAIFLCFSYVFRSGIQYNNHYAKVGKEGIFPFNIKTPSHHFRLSAISKKNWKAKVKPFYMPNLRYKVMLKV